MPFKNQGATYVAIDFYNAKNGKIYNSNFNGIKYLKFDLDNFISHLNGYTSSGGNLIIDAELH